MLILAAVKELSVLHDRHLHRPTLDDSSEEERAIEMLTEEITQVLYANYVCIYCEPRRPFPALSILSNPSIILLGFCSCCWGECTLLIALLVLCNLSSLFSHVSMPIACY